MFLFRRRLQTGEHWGSSGAAVSSKDLRGGLRVPHGMADGWGCHAEQRIPPAPGPQGVCSRGGLGESSVRDAPGNNLQQSLEDPWALF